MKILLPYKEPYNKKIADPIVTGGAEQFCKSIYDNFDVEVYQIPFKADSTWNIRKKREESRNIIKKARQMGADVIVNNWTHAIYNGSEISKSEIPIMNIVHNIELFVSR